MPEKLQLGQIDGSFQNNKTQQKESRHQPILSAGKKQNLTVLLSTYNVMHVSGCNVFGNYVYKREISMLFKTEPNKAVETETRSDLCH